MKLLLLADGASVHTEKWIEGLALSAKWRIHLVTLNPANTRAGIQSSMAIDDIYRLSPKSINESGGNFGYLAKLPEVYRIARRLRPDVVNGIYLTSYGAIASLVAGRAVVCNFAVGSDVMTAPQKGWINRQATSLALKRAHLVVSASRTMSEIITRDFQIQHDRILTQQYGVGDWVLALKAEKQFDLVSNRAWIANSNIPLVLRLLHEVSPQIRLALIGGEVVGSESVATVAKEYAPKLPQAAYLGSLPYEKNMKAVAQSNFLISLTQSDGAPLSVMEGMAVGAIPILSDIAPNREWVEHGVNGYLLPLDDFDESKRRLKAAFALSPQKMDAMRDLNRGIIEERGSLRVNMTRVSDRLEKLVHNNAT